MKPFTKQLPRAACSFERIYFSRGTDRDIYLERKELGVEDKVGEVPGLTMEMLVALGKDDIKSIDDFAGCAAEDLVGWTERKDGETQRFDGLFTPFNVSRADAEQMVINARLLAGWITEEDLQAADAEEGEEGAEESSDEPVTAS